MVLDRPKVVLEFIHAFQLSFNSLKGKLSLEGNAMMDAEAEELGFTKQRQKAPYFSGGMNGVDKFK